MQGRKKKNVKYFVDALMLVLMLFLAAYQVAGETAHEWLGVGMAVALIVHHLLNVKWTAALFKGKYNAYRAVLVATNALLLSSVALTVATGSAMSAHATPFLYGVLPITFARRFHLAMSFWTFVLIGFHLGLHAPTWTSGIKWNDKVKTAFAFMFAAIAGCGLWLFVRNGIVDYMFFRTAFAFFDFEKAAALVILENVSILVAFAFLGASCVSLITAWKSKRDDRKTRLTTALTILVAAFIGATAIVCTREGRETASSWDVRNESAGDADNQFERLGEVPTTSVLEPGDVDDGFVLIAGGSFLMGSPETEKWRIEDETQHEVSVSAFYVDPYETTQREYVRFIGRNPSSFNGDNLPVENISWLDALLFANAKSVDAGLTPAYTFGDAGVVWNRSANGYRLPTEAEWEYACRAGTTTPFNTEKSLDAEAANFFGRYPYEIEENYFDDSVLEARPGVYRQTTVDVGSFYKSKWGLFDMHGNVNEWCWDYYGAYDPQISTDPTGATSGTRHVYRGGGWNDFGKNMRSAYRAAGQSDMKAANLGVRLVRNATTENREPVATAEIAPQRKTGGKVLVAFFSWSGHTRAVAKEIQKQTGADLYEITLKRPYSTDYETVLAQSQEEQRKQARPEIENPLESIDGYDYVVLGYPNWWASIPMPIASFLEAYDFSGKTIVPFCSYGAGRFGQSLTAIAKLAPNATLGTGLAIRFSGDSTMPDEVSAWLDSNGVQREKR